MQSPPYHLEDSLLPGRKQTLEAKDVDASLVTALDHLAWGRSFGSCYLHCQCTCHHHKAFNDSRSSTAVYFGSYRSDMNPSIVLPSVDDARKLVNFYISHIAWHHKCLHSPTFLEQCEVFWQSGNCVDPFWMTLYLSVLNVSCP